MNSRHPGITIIIPTLNAEKTLPSCLTSIKRQKYPKDRIKIIVVDGKSTDQTLKIAKEFGTLIVSNSLKTAESGKSVGISKVTTDYVALIDSDNILPNENWLEEMVGPLVEHPEAAGSEPLKFTWRKEDGFVARYCALIGMNDPLVLFLGNYDRFSYVTGMWTEVPHEAQIMDNYILATFDKRGIPTIGANGTVLRTSFIRKLLGSNKYFFDIDLLAEEVDKTGTVTFIKTKNSIIHTFCESSVSKFSKKQRRRVKDFWYHRASGGRRYNWNQFLSIKNILKFILYTVTFVPLVVQAIKGYKKKKDWAWFFHPLACIITLWHYSSVTVLSIVYRAEADRKSWKQ